MHRRRKCCCMNNNMNMYKEELLEKKCNDVPNMPICCNEKDECACGFDDETQETFFPENPMFGQAYVPWQTMDKTFTPCVGLKMGTIFPELVSPYVPNQSLEEIEFIESMNQIGKGCNK